MSIYLLWMWILQNIEENRTANASLGRHFVFDLVTFAIDCESEAGPASVLRIRTYILKYINKKSRLEAGRIKYKKLLTK